jgi:hypothetical protein
MKKKVINTEELAREAQVCGCQFAHQIANWRYFEVQFQSFIRLFLCFEFQRSDPSRDTPLVSIHERFQMCGQVPFQRSIKVHYKDTHPPKASSNKEKSLFQCIVRAIPVLRELC